LRVARSYPHQLSGGMRQRAMIAQAIACHPQLIIADEPTSNLDVTLQAKIMALFRKLTRDLQVTIILISHDLGMVSHLADEIFVMTQSHVVESGSANVIMMTPAHPYTKELTQAFL
jgi:ABC-type dipeptide/oligopeptide/nickel transport system ATPase component